MANKFEKMEKRIDNLEERITKIEERLQSENPPTKRKPTSLPEFKLNYKPSNNKEKAVMVGYFYEKEKNMNNFTVNEIKDGFKKCKYPLPANMSDVIARASKDGLIMKAGKEGKYTQWMLTETGEKFVEGELKNE